MTHENYCCVIGHVANRYNYYCWCIVVFIFDFINPLQGRPLGHKKFTRTNLNWMCRVPGTDGFTSPPKDAVQGAPTHWV